MYTGFWFVFRKSVTVFSALALFATAVPAAFANPWSWTLGDARSVQYRTRDIAERLNREFPYSQATMHALAMDNAACQMVADIKCGASWEEVQASLSRTCALASQVNDMANTDCHVRNDKRTRDYLNDLSRRMERLRCNLDKAYARTQPKFCPQPNFCPPPIMEHRPNWGVQPQVAPIEYRIERKQPSHNPRAVAFVQLGLQALQLMNEHR